MDPPGPCGYEPPPPMPPGLEVGRSGRWPRVRAEHLQREPECVACGSTKDLEVHHISPYHLDPSRELDDDNLITLCGRWCHYVHGHLLSWRRSNPSVRADAVAYRAKLEASKLVAGPEPLDEAAADL